MRAPPYEKRQTAKRVSFPNYSKITQNNTNLRIPVITGYLNYPIFQIPRQKNKIEFKRIKSYNKIAFHKESCQNNQLQKSSRICLWIKLEN